MEWGPHSAKRVQVSAYVVKTTQVRRLKSDKFGLERRPIFFLSLHRYNENHTSLSEEVCRTVAVTLELAQTIAIGAFNPYLIRPDWLVKFKICPDEPLEVRLVPIGGGAVFSVGWNSLGSRQSAAGRHLIGPKGGLWGKGLEDS